MIFVYLYTKFSLAPLITLLDREEKHPFVTANRLVRGNFWTALALLWFVSKAVLEPAGCYNFVFHKILFLAWRWEFFINAGQLVLNLFSMPLIVTLQVVLYFRLKEAKRMD
jgi:hypothetical protein